MANDPVTTRERGNSTVLADTEPYNTAAASNGIHVYDRPTSAAAPVRSPVAMIITVLVALILIYFLYQWIF